MTSQTRDVTHMDESRHAFAWGMSRMLEQDQLSLLLCGRVSHESFMCHSCIVFNGVISLSYHILVESYRYHTNKLVMSYYTELYVNHAYVTLAYVWHGLLICVTWHMHLCAHPRQWWVRRSSIKTKRTLVCIHMCDMSHSYVWHDSFICVTWLIHMYDMTHS